MPKTILLAEDDQQVRRFASAVLRQNRFEVIEASSGAEALTVAGQHAGAIDLLLTDIIMPEINGILLVERLRSRRPEMEVLYMSGFVKAALVSRTVSDLALLRKPFRPEDLVAKIRQMLESKQIQDEEHAGS